MLKFAVIFPKNQETKFLSLYTATKGELQENHFSRHAASLKKLHFTCCLHLLVFGDNDGFSNYFVYPGHKQCFNYYDMVARARVHARIFWHSYGGFPSSFAENALAMFMEQLFRVPCLHNASHVLLEKFTNHLARPIQSFL